MSGVKGKSGIYKHRTGFKLSDETKLKISISKKGKPNGRLGKHLSEESKRKIGLANSISLKGKHPSKETRKKRSDALKGDKNHNWKGDGVGYVPLHTWVKRWKGTPCKCEACGTEIAKKYEWANIDHKYRRVLEDYVGMCTRCHRIYDIRNNNYVPFGIKKL